MIRSDVLSVKCFMGQHFLLSAAARSLSPAKIVRMSDRGVENVFLRLRWPQTDGKPVCPRCDCRICYDCRRSEHQPRWRCKACRADFSITSNTLFASHKLPLRSYLMAIAIFCNEVKGKSMLALCRDLDVQYKTAFVLAHKLREAMASSTKALRIGGEGRVAEVDGAYFGGHIRPKNLTADRVDRRLSENQQGKRKVVVTMRERGGRTLAQVFPAEADAVTTIRHRIAKGTIVHADEISAGSIARELRDAADQPSRWLQQTGPAPMAPSPTFPRLRRGEVGHHHHIAGPYLVRYAQEAAWRREILRRSSNGEQVSGVVSLAMRDYAPSVDFCGYWQRAPGLKRLPRVAHPTTHCQDTASHGLAHDRIGIIQAFALYRGRPQCHRSSECRYAFRLTQCIVVSAGKLARCEILIGLARLECRNRRTQGL